eukprot:gb/GECG01014000.1/.p1 GENE.gb/GECG01014000.1/~~gb/GECG01014000.1/.p1  ORF type:complete len:139 (+),score=8.90 gb/GECG01014000.1/:1-417(+)
MTTDFSQSSQCFKVIYVCSVKWMHKQPKGTSTHIADNSAETRILRVYFTRLIANIGCDLKLRHWVTATAIVYYRRFFSKHSLEGINPWLLTVSAVHLATLVEEQPKDIAEIYRAFQAREGKKILPLHLDADNGERFPS